MISERTSCLVKCLLIAIIFGAIAWIGITLTRADGRIAAVWLPNAFLLAVLLRTRGEHDLHYLAFGFIGNFTANLLVGDPLPHGGFLAIANTLEIALACVGMRKTCGIKPDLAVPRHLASFVLIAGLVAPATSASLAASVLASGGFGSHAALWLTWCVTDALGLLIGTPFLLILAGAWASRRAVSRRLPLDWGFPVGAATLLLLLIFAQTRFPLLFIVAPIPLVFAFRLGAAGTAVATAIIAAVASVMTSMGRGPIHLVQGDLTTKLVVLQTFLAVCFFMGLPVAAALKGRDRDRLALRREREVSRSMLENMREVVFRTDAEGQWVFLNPAWEALSGQDVASSLGRPIEEFFHPDDRPEARDAYARLASGESDEGLVLLRIHTRSGSVRWLEVSVRALRSASGDFEGTIGNLRDVTDRHQALEKLEANRNAFARLADSSPAGIYRTDHKGDCTYVNPAWSRLAGIAQEAGLGRGWGNAVHPNDSEDLARAWQETFEQGATFRREFRFLHDDGREVWVDAIGAPERLPDGRIGGYIGTVLDITEGKLAKTRLAASEEQLRLLAANATDAIFRLGLDGTCLYASPSVRDLLGIAPGHLVGADMLTGFHPDDADAVLAVHRALAGGRVERVVTAYRSRPLDGRAAWIWLEANCGLVRDSASGAPKEIIASIRDISDRKALELELESARRVAVAAAEAKSTFLANMSHEIRTPMNGVIGFTELLMQSPLSPEQRRHAQLIADSGRTMMQLLNDVLDISKIEAGQMRVVVETVDLRHLLRGSLKLVAPVAEAKGLALGLEVDACLPFWIEADGLRLRQVALNLLSNAVKFTERGSVTLRASAAFEDGAQQLRIQVVDTGIGIPAERQAAVLAPFQQADDHVARRFGGTGLGLAISDQLSRLMGGRLSLESEVGRGTTFTLTLPLKLMQGRPCGEKPASSPERTDDTAQAGSIRILVAEDVEVNQILMRDMLRSMGQEIELAVDGAEAVAMIASAADEGRPYRLVFMDVQMPSLDGLAATSLIRARGHAPEILPIIALTANAYAEDVAACLESGMQAHLSKPVRIEALREMLERFGSDPLPAQHDAAAASNLPPGLRAQFEERRDMLLLELENGVAAGRIEDAHALGAKLHQIAGTAALFGQSELGEAARDLQNLAGLAPAEQVRRAKSFLNANRKAA